MTTGVLVGYAAGVSDFARRFVRHLSDVGLTRTASSLAFTTLLGAVPLATVALVSVSHVPQFEQWVSALETFLLRHMLPASAHALVRQPLAGFIDNASELTGVSIALLALAAVMATATVEREINRIWGIHNRRPFARRLVVYAVGITAGPVLIGATIAALTSLLTESFAAVPARELHALLGIRPLPLIVVTLGLTLLYAVVPARRVPIRWALTGGFIAALALELAKDTFALYLTQVPTLRIVYGALSALPVFLLWIYLCWT